MQYLFDRNRENVQVSTAEIPAKYPSLFDDPYAGAPTNDVHVHEHAYNMIGSKQIGHIFLSSFGDAANVFETYVVVGVHVRKSFLRYMYQNSAYQCKKIKKSPSLVSQIHLFIQRDTF